MMLDPLAAMKASDRMDSDTLDNSDASDNRVTSESVDVPVMLLESLREPVAIIDEDTDRVQWVSTMWKSRLPGISIGDCWSQSVIDGPLKSSPVTQGLRLVRFPAERPAADDVRQYMQAREYLFSTSSTISVSEMATTLAHEINQPIGTITNVLRGVKTRLRQAEPSVDAIEHALDQALGQAQYTSSVIARIRDFTQARRPKQQQLDLRDVIAESVELLDWLFDTNACSVELKLPEQPLLLIGDETMLQQVLINLLRNAVDAMQEVSLAQRLLQISADCESGRIHVRIRDQGEGLSASEDTLFVPFVTSKVNGMGVGLNICRSFVELHQGRLWLSPNEEGGCTSNMELPLVVVPDNNSVPTP